MSDQAYEIITGRILNPGAGPTALAPNTGDSFQIRSTPDTSPPWLWGMWGSSATAGFLQVRSPRMHDVTRGLRFRLPAGTQRNLLPDDVMTQMYSQDTLIVEMGGGAAETDTAALLFFYPDLGGAAARLATWAQIQPLLAELVTVEVVVPAPAIAGDWSAGALLNSTSNLLKANMDYALIGYQTDTACLCVGVRGADTSNFRVGGPGPTETLETRDWFRSMSDATGVGAIPIINQANAGNTNVSVVQNTAAGNITVSLLLGRLAQKLDV